MRGVWVAALVSLTYLGCRFDLPAGPGDAPKDAPTHMDSDGPPPDGPSVQRCLTDSTYVDPGLGNSHRYKRLDADADYDTAIDRCAADGAHLAVVNDAAENNYLRGLHTTDMWIGYDDLTQENSFRWITGATGGHNGFSGMEPNDNGVEDCTYLRTNGSWNDTDCGELKRPVCECDPAYRPPATPACRTAVTGFTAVNGRRYFTRLVPKKWQQAQEDCASIGAHLIVVSDADENTALDALLVGPTWLGYTDTDMEGQFKWVNGATSPFIKWPGGDVPTEDNVDCAVLQDSGSWLNVDCNDSYTYACECDPAAP